MRECIVGAISGYLAYALGWTQEAIAAWFATTGIIVWIEYGLRHLSADYQQQHNV